MLAGFAFVRLPKVQTRGFGHNVALTILLTRSCLLFSFAYQCHSSLSGLIDFYETTIQTFSVYSIHDYINCSVHPAMWGGKVMNQQFEDLFSLVWSLHIWSDYSWTMALNSVSHQPHLSLIWLKDWKRFIDSSCKNILTGDKNLCL